MPASPFIPKTLVSRAAIGALVASFVAAVTLWFVPLAEAVHQPAGVRCRQVDGRDALLFAFGTLVYAASSVASDADRAKLHALLLDYAPDTALDHAFGVRRDVAALVEKWPAAERARMLQFLLLHRTAITNYNALVLQWVAPPPGFAVAADDANPSNVEPELFAQRSELANLLRQAWHDHQTQALWQREQASWQSQQIPNTRWRHLQHTLTHFLRLPASNANQLDASEVLLNPLMPRNTAVTAIFGDEHFVTIVGPALQQNEQDALISHEITHPIIQQRLHHSAQMTADFDASTCVFDAVAQSGDEDVTLIRRVYNTWESYFSEAVVRSITAELYPQAARVHHELAIHDAIDAQLHALRTAAVPQAHLGRFAAALAPPAVPLDKALAQMLQQLRHSRCAPVHANYRTTPLGAAALSHG